MKTGRLMAMVIVAAIAIFAAGPVLAGGLMPQYACPANYVFTPVPGIVINGTPMGNCSPPAYTAVACSGTPTIAITGVSPEVITARNSKTIDVTISGQISLPSNCNLGTTGYLAVDEYGESGGTGAISVSGGQFSAVVPVKAFRRGSDKDGRLYEITVSAEDEYGKGTSAPVSVTVAHDNSK